MENNPYQMICRAVVSGEVVELNIFRVPIATHFERKHKIEKTKDSEKGKREDNLIRARTNVRRIVWSNQTKYTKFLTLTYAKTTLDVKKVRRDLTTFFQGMRRLGYDLKYLYVLEHQKERGEKEGNAGSLHIHLLLFIDRYIPFTDINKCWKHGQTDIVAIDDINNLGAYVCKYITKDNVSLINGRSYSCSLGLDRPKEERFYSLGFSDSGVISPQDIIRGLVVCYSGTKRFDFVDSNGVAGTQTVQYIQGKWRDKNLIDALDPLVELDERIKQYDIS